MSLGTAPAYYYRDGTKKGSYLLFFEGGGWCFPSNPVHTGDNCYDRSFLDTGTSANYTPTMIGGGFYSSDPSISSFSDFNVAYMKYCDGGCFTGNKTEPDNLQGKDIWYRGINNYQAIMDDLVAKHDLRNAKEVVIGGLLNLYNSSTLTCLFFYFIFICLTFDQIIPVLLRSSFIFCFVSC